MTDNWEQDANCATTDPEAFFNEAGGRAYVNAQKVCDVCPVRRQCLDLAMRDDIRDGVWGGLTANQRARLKRANGVAA